MTDFLLLVLFGFIFHNINLLGLAVTQNLCSYISTFNSGLARNEAVAANCANLVELNCFFLSCLKLLNEDDIALGNLVLLSACFDIANTKSTSLSFMTR